MRECPSKIVSFLSAELRFVNLQKIGTRIQKSKYLRFSSIIQRTFKFDLKILRFTKFEIGYILISNIDEICSTSRHNVEKWMWLILHDQRIFCEVPNSYSVHQYNVGVLSFLWHHMLSAGNTTLFFLSRYTRRSIEIWRLRQCWHT